MKEAVLFPFFLTFLKESGSYICNKLTSDISGEAGALAALPDEGG